MVVKMKITRSKQKNHSLSSFFRQNLLSFLTGVKFFTEFKLGYFANLIVMLLISLLLGYLFYYYTKDVNYVVYFFIVWLLEGSSTGLGRKIKQGDLDKYLVFPINYFLLFFFFNLGDKFFKIILKLVILLIISIIFNVKISWLALVIYLFFARLFNSIYVFTIECIAFFVYEPKGIFRIISSIEKILNGSLIPLNFFSKVIETILVFSFFPLGRYYLYLAATNQLTMLHILNYIFWFIVFSLLATWLWKKGLKAYESQFN